MNLLYPWQNDDWSKLNAFLDNLPQGLLVHGAKGIGKTHLVRLWGQSHLCSNRKENFMPCMECPSCKWFKNQQHPDARFILPNDRGQITVDQIRDLFQFLGLSSHQSGFRIILVEQADRLNTQSANAFLKMLEEPPAKTLFLLVTDQFNQLLPTIKSRTQHVNLALPHTDLSIDWLKNQGHKNPESLLAQASGSPILAHDYANPEYQKQRDHVIKCLIQPRNFNIYQFAEELNAQKINKQQRLNDLITWIQQFIYDICSLITTDFERIKFNIEYKNDLMKLIEHLGKKHSIYDVFEYYKRLIEFKKISQHTLNIQLFTENLLLDYLKLFA